MFDTEATAAVASVCAGEIFYFRLIDTSPILGGLRRSHVEVTVVRS